MPSSVLNDTQRPNNTDEPWHKRDYTLSQRRVRHVSYLQVRNLTPFPVRDAFASALAQPSTRSQFTPQGNLSDDLDVTVGRKRGRKISSTSTHTLKSEIGDEHSPVGIDTEGGFRRRTSSKASINGGASTSIGSSSSGPSARRSNHRPRAGSTASYSAARRSDSFTGSITTSNIASETLSKVFSDYSQDALEKVVNSRLVETFITVRIPRVSSTTQETLSPLSIWSARPLTPPRSPPFTPLRSAPPTQKSHRRGAVSVSTSNKSTSRSSTSKSKAHVKSASVSTSALTKAPPPVSLAFPEPTKIDEESKLPSIPNYISPIHRPSINPLFSIGAQSSPEIMQWADTSLGEMKVELWGKVGTGWGDIPSTKNKGKEREIHFENGDLGWQVLESWDVDLSELVSIPHDPSSHASRLPSNTLVVHLSPPDQTFYVPLSSHSRLSSRPPSPGHNSEPEVNSGRSPLGASNTQPNAHVNGDKRTNHRGASVTRHARELSTTAGWQDFVKLTTLQAVIADSKQSLAEIEQHVERMLLQDETSTLKYEISEREAWVSDLRFQREDVSRSSGELRQLIESRKTDMRQRREALSQAREIFGEQLDESSQVEDLLNEEREQLTSLRSRLSPTRTTLLTTLAGIFPIELLSPPDLLFTILSVPLPIPLLATDPAPPLSLPSHKEVTEDGVATALGLAAQVVHLMAIYLGKVLVYPITCVGSRSLIKDNISAMVGPRMFPLFTKGVDTYRFEYGVFLLNKDIEMLMAERNLRALDMRHTLPNLKNLLLTLTNGESVTLPVVQVLNSPAVTGLESPPRVATPPAIELTKSTPPESPKSAAAEDANDSDSPTASGSTTPTKATEQGTPRKSRAFLDLSPFTGFLRGRYPSSIRTSTSKESTDAPDVRPGTPEDAEHGGEEVDNAIDVGEVSSQVDAKTVINGHANGNGLNKEKLEGLEDDPTSTAHIPVG